MKLNGILLLDKPSGYTSNQILQQVKRMLKVSTKAGHTGSLDPIATGMLPICFGEATKFAGQLLMTDKVYQVKIQLGIKTDTADLDGKIIARNSSINEKILAYDYLEGVLAQFVGETLQQPPIYSALKNNGVPLYKLARQASQTKIKDSGKTKESSKIEEFMVYPQVVNLSSDPRSTDLADIVKAKELAHKGQPANLSSGKVSDLAATANNKEFTGDLAAAELSLNPELLNLAEIVKAKTRIINIKYIKILDIYESKQQISLEVACSKGTYIRSLVEDIATKLGCYACVAALRRIKVANFNEDKLVTVEQLQQLLLGATNQDNDQLTKIFSDLLLPLEQCLDGIPRYYLDVTQTVALQRGQQLHIPGINNLFGENVLVGLFTMADKQLLGLGSIIDNDKLLAKRLLSF